jgi:hypothetical protein
LSFEKAKAFGMSLENASGVSSTCCEFSSVVAALKIHLHVSDDGKIVLDSSFSLIGLKIKLA